MNTSDNLLIPYIQPAQAQKHITHNEAMRCLDALVQLSVTSRVLAAPPVSPAAGERFLVPAGATGLWAGGDGQIAAWQDGAWNFYAPRSGWLCWVADEGSPVVFDGDDWLALDNTGQAGILGVNTTADATNRLAVASPATLLTHEGGGHQLKLNKVASGETASILFQDGFSSRAEIGLSGDDDFHVKVSPDGTSFLSSITVNRNNGHAAFFVENGGRVELSAYGIGASPRMSVVADKTDGARAYMEFRHDSDTHAAFYTEFDSATGDADFNVRCLRDGARISFITRGAGVTNWAHFLLDGATANVGVGVAAPSARLDVDGAVKVGAFTMASLPSASLTGAGAVIYVSDEAAGPTLAFSDGSDWRRVGDGAVTMAA